MPPDPDALYRWLLPGMILVGLMALVFFLAFAAVASDRKKRALMMKAQEEQLNIMRQDLDQRTAAIKKAAELRENLAAKGQQGSQYMDRATQHMETVERLLAEISSKLDRKQE